MQQLLLSDIWTEIKKRSRRARNIQAAIAYVSTGVHLRLKPGDTLVVNASDHAIRTGATSARVLWKWGESGVKLFTSDRIHAKLIVMDDVVLVGSANASTLSAQQLYEAAILTDSFSMVSQARSFVHQLTKQAQPLNEENLRRLLAIPVRTSQMPLKSRRKPIEARGNRTWVVSAEDLDEGEYDDEQWYVERAEQELPTTHPDADPCWIRWTGKARIRDQARNGDCFIVHTKKKGHRIPYEVSPPSTLLRRQPQKHHDRLKWMRFYYDPDLADSMKTLNRREFQNLLKVANIRTKLKPNSTRALSFQDAMELQRLWPRKRGRTS